MRKSAKFSLPPLPSAPLKTISSILPLPSKVAPSPSLPKVAPSPSLPKVAPSPSLPKVAPSPSLPKVAPSPSLPKVAPSPSLPKVAPSLPKVAPSLPKVAPSLPKVAPSLPKVAPSLPKVVPSLPKVDPSPSRGLPLPPKTVPSKATKSVFDKGKELYKRQEQYIMGNKDLEIKMLDYLDDESLFNLCSSSKTIRKFCENDTIWKERLRTRYPFFFSLHPNENNFYREYYRDLKNQIKRVLRDSKKYIKRALRDVLRKEKHKMLDVSSESDLYLAQESLKILKKTSLDLGYVDLFKYFMSMIKGYNYIDKYNDMESTILHTGSLDIFKYINEKTIEPHQRQEGEDEEDNYDDDEEDNYIDEEDKYEILRLAIVNNRIEIVDYIINNFEILDRVDSDLLSYCESVNMLKYLLQKLEELKEDVFVIEIVELIGTAEFGIRSTGVDKDKKIEIIRFLFEYIKTKIFNEKDSEKAVIKIIEDKYNDELGKQAIIEYTGPYNLTRLHSASIQAKDYKTVTYLEKASIVRAQQKK